jgi:hypothetical protein
LHLSQYPTLIPDKNTRHSSKSWVLPVDPKRIFLGSVIHSYSLILEFWSGIFSGIFYSKNTLICPLSGLQYLSNMGKVTQSYLLCMYGRPGQRLPSRPAPRRLSPGPYLHTIKASRRLLGLPGFIASSRRLDEVSCAMTIMT